jgi:phosphodiesterase/alkaline phosphatase D-like protein
MRMRMAELFGDQSCVRWWLADDEGFTNILKSVRIFADERNATAVTAQSENLREIRHIFAKMQLSGLGDSPQSDGAAQAKGKGKEPSA